VVCHDVRVLSEQAREREWGNAQVAVMCGVP